MSIVNEEDITGPRIRLAVSLKIIVGLVCLALIAPVFLILIPSQGSMLKLVAFAAYNVLLILLIKKAVENNLLLIMQANKKGIFLRTSSLHKNYFHIPWNNIGEIENADFPCRRKGLKIEVTGDYLAMVKNNSKIGKVTMNGEKVYLYTPPQIRYRSNLLNNLQNMRGS